MKLITAAIAAFLINLVNSFTINCDFHISTKYFAPTEVYECRVTNYLVINSPNQKVEAIVGNHFINMTNNDVTGIRIKEKSLKFMPKNLDQFFPNLKVIFISRSGLCEIHESDLRAFKSLVNLDLSYNDIKVIERNLFKYNEKLEVLVLKNNPLQHVHLNVFDHLRNLKYFAVNGCWNGQVSNNKTAVKSIVHNLRENCYDREIAVENYDKLSENFEELKIKFKEIKINLKESEEKLKISKENSEKNVENLSQNLEFYEAKFRNLQMEKEISEIHAIKREMKLKNYIKMMAIGIGISFIALIFTSLTLLYMKLLKGESRKQTRDEYDAIESQEKFNTNAML
ncbi:hypothetical protein PVAND_016871 [Polypedilum vanderplanki]|uniref:Uncharacterized protein n=1 Tax=Polypedilum vanderplanki TaxID=319348 RepID=A0A9J6BHN7_POLVA|nr:hypothetical protein PVAND_016871 [Polypedilum vanderplanki]